ncbi:MAG: hypothetical protein ABIJ16_05080 [Bacteroidota bacterium]
MKSLKAALFTIAVIAFMTQAYSQMWDETPVSEKNFGDRLFFGGGFGMNFGTTTMIEVAPLIGYQLTDEITVGTGFTYKYISGQYVNGSTLYRFETTLYGGKAFANYMIAGKFFPHIEYEGLSLEKEYFDFAHGYPDDGRFWYHSILVGAGYYMPFKGRGGMYIIGLYNLNDSSNSPYGSPLIWRMGFTF